MWEERKIWDGLLTTTEGGAELPVPEGGGLICEGGALRVPISVPCAPVVPPPRTSAHAFSSWPNPACPSRAGCNPRPQTSYSPPFPPRSLVYPSLNAFIQQTLIEHLHICRKAFWAARNDKPHLQGFRQRSVYCPHQKVSVDRFRVKLSGTLLAFQHACPSWLSDGQLSLWAPTLRSKQEEGRAEVSSTKAPLVRKSTLSQDPWQSLLRYEGCNKLHICNVYNSIISDQHKHMQLSP